MYKLLLWKMIVNLINAILREAIYRHQIGVIRLNSNICMCIHGAYVVLDAMII